MTAGEWFDPIGQEWRTTAFIVGREARLKEAARKDLERVVGHEVTEHSSRYVVEVGENSFVISSEPVSLPNSLAEVEAGSAPRQRPRDDPPSSPGSYWLNGECRIITAWRRVP